MRRPTNLPGVSSAAGRLWFVVGGLVVLLAAAAREAHPFGGASRSAFDGGPEIVGVRVGFQGRRKGELTACYKAGVWTPVEVTLRGGSRPVSGRLSLAVPDGDGVPSRVVTPPDQPCRVLSGRDTTAVLYARFGRVRSELSVAFRVDGRRVAQRVFAAAEDTPFPPARPASARLIVSVGAGPLGVEEAVGLLRRGPQQQTIAVRLEGAGQLPGQWNGYEGIDTLVLSTSRPEIYRDLAPGCPQIEALERWARAGGKVIVCVGSGAEQFHGGKAVLRPLARLLPGRLETEREDGKEKIKIFPLRQTGSLESYCGGLTPVPSEHDDGVLRVAKLVDVDPDAVVEAREADLPLVVRVPRGFGQIVFFAGDLDRKPLRRWKDRAELVSKLLGLPTRQTEEPDDRAAMMHHGFDDMAGQLRRALDQFTEVRLVPFWAVVVLIVAYVFLIGPGDYFLLRKLTGRMEWTWVTFPLIVLAFSIGAVVLARWLKGNQVRINQIDLVEVDAASDCRRDKPGVCHVRGTSWMNIFSPRTESFNFSLRPRLLGGQVARHADVLLGWLGVPGGGFGGMGTRGFDPVRWAEPYDVAPGLDALEGLPIRIASTKSLTARWNAQTALPLEADLVEQGQVLTGTITNGLDFPLSEYLLVHKGYAYTLSTRDNRDTPDQPGTLQPGEVTVIGAQTRWRELKNLLTGLKLVKLKDTSRLMATQYDPSSVELPYILRVMMFFEEAGGRGYTGLSNGYQGFVDLSHLLKTNRAILVAQAPAGRHGAELLRDGRPMIDQEDQHVTIYRFVFPVREGGRSA